MNRRRPVNGSGYYALQGPSRTRTLHAPSGEQIGSYGGTDPRKVGERMRLAAERHAGRTGREEAPKASGPRR